MGSKGDVIKTTSSIEHQLVYKYMAIAPYTPSHKAWKMVLYILLQCTQVIIVLKCVFTLGRSHGKE